MEHHIFQLTPAALRKKKFMLIFILFQVVVIAGAFLTAAFWFRDDISQNRFQIYLLVAPIIFSIGLVASLVAYKNLLKVRLEIADKGIVQRSMFSVKVIQWDQVREIHEVLGTLQVTARNYDTIEFGQFEDKEEIKRLLEEELETRKAQPAGE